MMWFEEIDELFKTCVPYYVLVVLPLFIIVSPINPAMASHEFPVYRMQHFDLHGVPHGCRSAVVNLEVRSLHNWSTSRHCIITKLQELTIDHFRNLRNKAGALLVILPENITNLNAEQKDHLQILESVMLSQEIAFPVYFAKENRQLNDIVIELGGSNFVDEKQTSATKVLISSITANGYQLAINAKTPAPRSDMKIATIQGNLIGYGIDNINAMPTIAIVAHYDSFGIAPELTFGADSNGSGVAVLLELVRLFSNLYSDPRTHGVYNIVFILSGGGKFNYQGSKKWLEDQLDSLDGSIIQQASYIMCLDTLAASNAIYMHVSKPPKEESAAAEFFKSLKNSANKLTVVEGVHKKINLAEDLLAWEHERFSIRRLPAFTLSALKSHKDSKRGTILDTRQNLNLNQLVRNTEIIANALAKSIFNISEDSVFGKSIKVERSSIESWVNYLSSQTRSAQILSNKDNTFVHLLKDTFSKYLHEVKVTYALPDKRDPDFVFYDVTKSTMNIYSVKPAFFDLILTFGIVAYLGVTYLVIQQFPIFYTIASRNPKEC